MIKMKIRWFEIKKKPSNSRITIMMKMKVVGINDQDEIKTFWD